MRKKGGKAMNDESHAADGMHAVLEQSKEERCLALVLGGGGGKGGAHLGVLSELEAAQVPFDMIVGTSIGALVGVLYAAGYSVELIGEGLRHATMWRIFQPDLSGAGLTSNAPLRALLKAMLGDRTFEDLTIPCAVTAVDLVSGRVVVLDSGPLVDALLASIALPAIFPAVARGEQRLVDGGMLNNLPINIAQQRGAQKVIAVELFLLTPGETREIEPETKLAINQQPNAFDVAARTREIIWTLLQGFYLQHAWPDVLIQPDLEHIGYLDFQHMDEGRQIGSETARQMLPMLEHLRAWRMAAANPASSTVALAGRRIISLPPELQTDSLFQEERSRMHRFVKAKVARLRAWFAVLKRAVRAVFGEQQPARITDKQHKDTTQSTR
jgi:NTE family protein